jgi:DoxX-like family
MNILLWILQSLLAAHTLMGAVWKFSNPAQNMPSLAAIPPRAWLGLSVVEILCVVGLLLPALGSRFALTSPVAAGIIAAEMILFCVLHFISGEKALGPIVYWLVVAALSGFIVFGRLSLKPH